MRVTNLIFLVAFFTSNSFAQKNNKLLSQSQSVEASKIDFFKVPKDCAVRYSGGALQWTQHSGDSTNYLCFANVYCKNSYEIIFLYRDIAIRKAIGYDVSDIFFSKQLGSNNFENFECYVFVYPQRDLNEQTDIHGSNIDFPVDVNAYKRYWDNNVPDNENHYKFKFISKTRVENFEQLSEFQFKVMYDLVDAISN